MGAALHPMARISHLHRTDLRLLVLVLPLTVVTACAHVQPWEKESQAALDEHQELESDGATYEAHFWSVREAAAGGTGQPGGGCGCN